MRRWRFPESISNSSRALEQSQNRTELAFTDTRIINHKTDENRRSETRNPTFSSRCDCEDRACNGGHDRNVKDGRHTSQEDIIRIRTTAPAPKAGNRGTGLGFFRDRLVVLFCFHGMQYGMLFTGYNLVWLSFGFVTSGICGSGHADGWVRLGSCLPPSWCRCWSSSSFGILQLRSFLVWTLADVTM